MSLITGAVAPETEPRTTDESETGAAERTRRASGRRARVAYVIGAVWVVIGFVLYAVQVLRILH
jgi:hypothetical protein